MVKLIKQKGKKGCFAIYIKDILKIYKKMEKYRKTFKYTLIVNIIS